MSRKVNIQAYADYFGVSRQAIHAWLRKYIDAEKGEYNPYDMTSVFAFFEYLQRQYYPASGGASRRFSPQQS